MKTTLRLLARELSRGNGLKAEPMALLPPIPLYRRILRAHRTKLPPALRSMGDTYVKSEFRLHQNAEKPAHIIAFLTEWQLYAQQIEGDSWQGEKLDPQKVAKMSDQQVGQMWELLQAIKKSHEEEGD
ncbi:hypothetical protein F4777DRAFT_545425 [Nemania sp. FL0916]|nr:hypothetical protein F4777DRAFT_545425 [Nemania sp. FL0916]